MARQMNKRTLVWGIDESGDLVCPVIYLWKSKKGIMKADNVGGALKHGDEVEIIRRHKDGWVSIRANVEHEGKIFPQKGLVRESLIKVESLNG